MLKIAAAAAFIVLVSVFAVKSVGRPPAPTAAVAAQTAVTPEPASAAPAPPARNAQGRATVTLAADARGHFVANLQINNVIVRTLVDTGASTVALSAEDARRVGVFPTGADFRIPVNTANGVIRAAQVRLPEVRLNGIVVRDVEAMVMPAGRLEGTLLGMSFLRRLGGMEFAQGRLVLTQ